MRVIIQNKGLTGIDTNAIAAASMKLEKPRGRGTQTRALIGTHEGLFLCHVNFNQRRIIVVSQQAKAIPADQAPPKESKPKKSSKKKTAKTKATKAKPTKRNEPEDTIAQLLKSGEITSKPPMYYYNGEKYRGMKNLIKAFL